MKKQLLLSILTIGLINSGVQVKSNDSLFKCIENKDISGVKSLLDDGADINARDENGKTALMYAVYYYSKTDRDRDPELDIIKSLLKSGADINAQDNNGKTVLMHAVNPFHGPSIYGSSCDDYLTIVKFLLANGVNIYARNNDGYTVLELVTKRNKRIDKDLDRASYYEKIVQLKQVLYLPVILLFCMVGLIDYAENLVENPIDQKMKIMLYSLEKENNKYFCEKIINLLEAAQNK